MFPFLPYIVGATTTVACRILLGEHRVPEVLQSQLGPLADSMSDASDFLGNFKAETLSNWLKLGEHGIRQAINADTYEDLAEWMDAHEMCIGTCTEAFAYLPLFETAEVKEHRPYLYPGTENDPDLFEIICGTASLYVTVPKGKAFTQFVQELQGGICVPFKAYFPKNKNESARVKEAIREAFWKKHNAVTELEVENGGLFVYKHFEMTGSYYGSHWGLPEKWMSLAEKHSFGAHILGRSGNGKTTFAHHAAKRFASANNDAKKDSSKYPIRCLSLHQEVVESLDSRRWLALCELLKPYTVIFEDLEPKKLSHVMKKVLLSREGRVPKFTLVILSEEEDEKSLFPKYLDEVISVDDRTEQEALELIRTLAACYQPISSQPLSDESIQSLLLVLEEHSVAHVISEIKRGEAKCVTDQNSRQVSGLRAL